MRYVLGIDIGGTNVVAGCVSEDGAVLHGLRSEPTVAEKPAASGRLELAVVRFRDALLLPASVKPPALQISLRHPG